MKENKSDELIKKVHAWFKRAKQGLTKSMFRILESAIGTFIAILFLSWLTR